MCKTNRSCFFSSSNTPDIKLETHNSSEKQIFLYSHLRDMETGAQRSRETCLKFKLSGRTRAADLGGSHSCTRPAPPFCFGRPIYNFGRHGAHRRHIRPANAGGPPCCERTSYISYHGLYKMQPTVLTQSSCCPRRFQGALVSQDVPLKKVSAQKSFV